MKNKKIIIIFSILFIMFFGIIVLFFSIKKDDEVKIDDTEYNNLENSSMFNDAIIVDKTKTEPKKTEENYIIEEVSNIHEIQIENKAINIDLSKNNMLSYSNFKLNDNYYLTEILIAKKDNSEYLNDAQLSTTYDSAKNYSKIWYLYDLKNTYLYEVVDLTDGNNLILNTVINNNYLEFDFMSNSIRTTTANHYKIDINEFINKVINGESFDYYNYSTYKEQNLELENSNLKSSQKINLDLDGDSKEENISIEIYENGEDYYYSGYKLSINNEVIEGQIDWPNKQIGIIELSDKVKGIVITNYENEIQDYMTIIYTYDGDKIIESFKSTKYYGLFVFENKEGFKNINVKKENEQILLNTEIQDNIQNWELIMKYRLNDNKILQLVVEDYYLNTTPIEATTTQNVYLYTSKDFNSEKVLIESNNKVDFIGTDLNYWGVVKYKDKIYYLALNTDGTIKDLNIEAAGIFNGIYAAD